MDEKQWTDVNVGFRCHVADESIARVVDKSLTSWKIEGKEM